MSETTTAPRPGSVEAFKQRHEAYALVRGMPEILEDARSRLAYGQPKIAGDDVEWLMGRIERNPEARRMADARHPNWAKEATDIAATATSEARHQVDLVKRGEWTPDHGLETRLDIGKSDQGWHYQLHVNRQNWENDPSWSRAFPTQKAAEGAGWGSQAREHGWEMRHADVPQTLRGRHAELLSQAAESRREAQGAIDGRTHWRSRADAVDGAKAVVEEARMARQTGRAWHIDQERSRTRTMTLSR